MKRTDRLTIFIAVLLFLGFLAYLGSYAFRALENGVVTAEAISADFDLSGTASGILIREETVLTSSAPYVDVTAANGARVAAGSVVATAVSGPEGLERANRIHALETEIERVSAALAGLSSVSSVTSRETALNAAARNVAAVAARHDMLNLDSAATQLSGLLLGVDSSQISYARLDELRASCAPCAPGWPTTMCPSGRSSPAPSAPWWTAMSICVWRTWTASPPAAWRS